MALSAPSPEVIPANRAQSRLPPPSARLSFTRRASATTQLSYSWRRLTGFLLQARQETPKKLPSPRRHRGVCWKCRQSARGHDFRYFFTIKTSLCNSAVTPLDGSQVFSEWHWVILFWNVFNLPIKLTFIACLVIICCLIPVILHLFSGWVWWLRIFLTSLFVFYRVVYWLLNGWSVRGCLHRLR